MQTCSKWILGILLIKAPVKCDQNLSSISELKIALGKTWQWLVLSDFSDEISCFCLLGPAQTGSSITEEFPGRGKSLCFSWCFPCCFTWGWCAGSLSAWRGGYRALEQGALQGFSPSAFCCVQDMCVVRWICVLDKLNWSNDFAFSIPERKLAVAVAQVAQANSLCLSGLMVWTLLNAM